MATPRCKFSGCSAPAFVSLDGSIFPFCSVAHANAAASAPPVTAPPHDAHPQLANAAYPPKRGVEPDASASKFCQFQGCLHLAYIDPNGVSAKYCSRKHRDAAQQQAQQQQLSQLSPASPVVVEKKGKKDEDAPAVQIKADPDFGAPLVYDRRPYKNDPVAYQLLLRATMSGSEEQVRQALKLGGDPRAYFENPEDPWSPVHYAASCGFTAILRILLEACADPDPYGADDAAIVLAAKHGHLACVKLLARNGAIRLTHSTQSPLRAAINNKQILVAEWLIMMGFSKDYKDEQGFSVSNIQNHYWRDRLTSLTSIHKACRDGNLPMVKQILDAGLPVDFLNAGRMSPLFAAFGNSFVGCLSQYNPPAQLAVAEYLLSRGANINDKCHDMTILHYMVERAGTEATTMVAIDFLLAHGANPNALNDYGQSPLHYAGNQQLFDLLVKHGADPRLKDQDGNVPGVANAKYRTQFVDLCGCESVCLCDYDTLSP